MARILIVEDEAHLAEGLTFNLKAEGHQVEVASEGEKALVLLGQGHSFDCVVLDVMLPGMTGFDVAHKLRARGEFIPILMLTARNRSQDVMKGFAAGADDYLPKPFELGVLFARLNALLRRRQWAQSPPPSTAQAVLRFGDNSLDMDSLELNAHGTRHQLTTMEAELLRYLITHAGQALSRKKILEDVWGLREDTDTRAIDNFIARLRKFVEKRPSAPKYLVTVRGVGYKFVAEPK